MLWIQLQNLFDCLQRTFFFLIKGFRRRSHGFIPRRHFFNDRFQRSEFSIGKPADSGCFGIQSLQLFFAQASSLLVLLVKADDKRGYRECNDAVLQDLVDDIDLFLIVYGRFQPKMQR